MNVSCPHCKTTVRVDRKHVPQGGVARVSCPSCSQPFHVSGREEPTDVPAAGPGADIESWLHGELESFRASLRAELVGHVSGAKSVARAARGERSRLALICESDAQAAGVLADALKGMGYQPQVAADVPSALALLARTEYSLVSVDAALTGDPQGGMKVLGWINGRPGPDRRRMFVVYVNSDVASMDTGSAFIAGANLTVNLADAPRLKEMLKKGLSETEDLYRVFDEVTESVSEGR